MNETTTAFEAPHVRAALSSGPAPLDRISVRDYVRRVEIGAFASERGVEQRVRFNVVLEVCHHAAAEADDVDLVLSYDTITAAIEAELGAERISLLETLAERVARRCLSDPRAVRVFVRVEKLDRIPGALGVEIVRLRAEGLPRLRPSDGPIASSVPAPVLFAPASLLAGPEAGRWRDALAAVAPCIVALAPAIPQPRAAGDAALRAGLLAIDQAAWTLAATDGRFLAAATRTEIEWGLGEGRAVAWCPVKLVVDAVPRVDHDASAPEALAAWLARTLDRPLYGLGPEGPAAWPRLETPQALAPLVT
jgi:dihydroneopterin aldolase